MNYQATHQYCSIFGLLFHPALGRPGRVPGTRELVVTRTSFIVPYRIMGERVEILAVIHVARRWPDSF